MAVGLAVSDVVAVNVSMTPLAVPVRNFGALAILGPSNVIDVGSRLRQYATLAQVATDFGTTAPEYLAAALFFAQDPKPSILYIGKWAQTAASGLLNGAPFTPAEQTTLLASLQAVTTGGMTISIDGTPRVLTAMNFSAILNLNGAASIINTAITTWGTCVWDATIGRFVITSKSSGGTSTVSYATDPGTGTALATLLRLTAASGASAPVAGIPAETPVAAVQAIAPLNADVYGIMFAGTLTDAQHIAVATYIEAAVPSRIYGITVADPLAIDSTATTDLASLLKAGNYSRTFWQFSRSSPYAIASAFAREFTIDFTAANTTNTMKFKQEPTVVAEVLTETQAQTLKNKNGNVFVSYMNGTAILQEGVMANGIYFDERHGSDWLQNRVQSDVYNLFYTSPTKIPQTDAGVHQVATTIEAGLEAGVTNGFIAPGQWNSAYEFGLLKTGQTLAKGYYVYAPAVASQAQSDREARKAPTIQCAIKMAGAIHSANVIINVNR